MPNFDPTGKTKGELAAEVARLAAELRRAEERIVELEIRSEELTQQEERLRESRVELEESRDRYAELYDLAPVAYLTFDGHAVILELNLTACHLLGLERARAIRTPFLVHVAEVDRVAFLEHMRRCRSGEAEVVSELSLAPRRSGTRSV